MKRIVILLSLVASLLAACDNKPKMEYYKESGERFHTLYHITYESDRLLTEQIDSTMTLFNEVLNVFDPTSVASRFNLNLTDTLHPMLADVILQAKVVSEATGGMYDITGAPLFDLWGFGTRKGVTRQATQSEIDSIMAFVGYQLLTLDEANGRIVKADPRVTINPSSLSKGYVTDLVAQTLEEHGVENYLVEIGGEIKVKGVNPRGECWKIAVDKPIPDRDSFTSEPMFVLPLCDEIGVASSGDYRNFKLLEGKRVAHTINNLTGYPAHQDILSSTVVASTSMEADAWATAFMALGLEKSLEVLEKQPHLAVCFIYENPESGQLTTYERGLDNLELLEQ